MKTGEQEERWLRLPGEPARWFARFEQYRLLGPRRTLEAAFAACKKSEGLAAGARRARPGTQWYDVAKRWDWKGRAEAWDEVERAAFLESERARRLDARRRRLEIIESAQEQAYAALLAANLAALKATDLEDVAAARELLASVRVLLMDALKAQRLEYDESTEIVEAGIDLTADDLHAGVMVERNNHGHAVLLALKEAKKTRLMDGHDKKTGWLSNAKGKVLLYDLVAEVLRDGVTLLADPETRQQLASIEANTLRAPQGLHDDHADAYALALAGLRFGGGPSTSTGGY